METRGQGVRSATAGPRPSPALFRAAVSCAESSGTGGVLAHLKHTDGPARRAVRLCYPDTPALGFFSVI